MTYVRSLAAISFLAAACATTATSFTDDDAGDAGNTTADAGDAQFSGDTVVPEAGPGKVIFYAHTNTTLYKVDSDDPQLGITEVGTFDCIATDGGSLASSMTDIAVDKDGKLYGVAREYVFLDMTVSGNTVQCKGKEVRLQSIGDFYGASMAPVGTLDPQKEVLVVADSAGDLYRVDTSNGQYTKVGNLGTVPANDGNGHPYDGAHIGKRWALSGDIVFLENKGQPVGFATVRDCNDPAAGSGCADIDTLIELDIKKLSSATPNQSVLRSVRGQIRVQNTGCPKDGDTKGYNRIYGVAAVGTSIIGFSRGRDRDAQGTGNGLVLRVDNDRGPGCLVADHSGTAATGGGWAGAGVTTLAPVTVPPPR
jgi:hypothetical protein